MINVKNIYWMLAYAFQSVNLSDAKKISMETGLCFLHLYICLTTV